MKLSREQIANLAKKIIGNANLVHSPIYPEERVGHRFARAELGPLHIQVLYEASEYSLDLFWDSKTTAGGTYNYPEMIALCKYLISCGEQAWTEQWTGRLKKCADYLRRLGFTITPEEIAAQKPIQLTKEQIVKICANLKNSPIITIEYGPRPDKISLPCELTFDIDGQPCLQNEHVVVAIADYDVWRSCQDEIRSLRKTIDTQWQKERNEKQELALKRFSEFMNS